MFDVFYVGKKPNVFAHEQPAASIEDAAKKSVTKFFWVIDAYTDYTNFDFMWRPDKWEEKFIHVFPSQWQKASGTFFAQKETAHKKEYHFRKDIEVVKIPGNLENWTIPEDIVPDSVDYSWHPDPLDKGFSYRFGSAFQRNTGVSFNVGTRLDPIKYVKPFEVRNKPSKKNWIIPDGVDESSIDFTWRPDVDDPPFIYVFGSKYQRNSGVQYVVSGATQRKYVKPFEVRNKPSKENWVIPEDVDEDTIDFTWRPDVDDPPYQYIFASKYQQDSGVRYEGDRPIGVKYVKPFEVRNKPSKKNWIIPDGVDESSIDFTWRPEFEEIRYGFYIFPTKYQKNSGVMYRYEDATNMKFVDPFIVRYFPSKKNWIIPEDVDENTIDFTWRPDAGDNPYIYNFPTVWAKDSGLKYRVPGATQEKYVDDIFISFDPSKLPRYYIETTLSDLIKEHPNENFWALNRDTNYDEFDFSWRPSSSQLDYVHVFGTQWKKHGDTAFVPAQASRRTQIHNNGRGAYGGYCYRYVGDISVSKNSVPNIYFINRYNIGAEERLADLQARFENVIPVRYVKDVYSTLARISTKEHDAVFWVISSDNDYSDFDFTWEPDLWEQHMFHVFGTEDQPWSDTFYVNNDVLQDHLRWCKSFEEMPDLNFVKTQTVKPINTADIYMIDFGNGIAPPFSNIKTTRFTGNYAAVLRRIIESATTDNIWVISNVCEYDKFDFNWRPSVFESSEIHCFGSKGPDQSVSSHGDTFYIRRSLIVRSTDTKKEWSSASTVGDLGSVHFHDEITVPRIPFHTIRYDHDDLTTEIKNHVFTGPYAWFCHDDTKPVDYTPTLWSEKDRALHTFSESSSIVLAPRDMVKYLGAQCYDYPHILKHKDHFCHETPLNIIFISNGEPKAETLFNHLKTITEHDPQLIIKRIDGVKGRANAYKAAANASDTEWFFTVFGKLEISPDFDWYWQPDRLQEPKHYIFYAINPVNGLEYGHMGMIAYNKRLVLETDNWGLDFTLSKAHEVVPLISGTAHYNVSPTITWRTAFRECIKLLADGSEESIQRFEQWNTADMSQKNAEWSIRGAKDAKRYFDSVNGRHDELMKSFEWEWLDQYMNSLYPK